MFLADVSPLLYLVVSVLASAVSCLLALDYHEFLVDSKQSDAVNLTKHRPSPTMKSSIDTSTLVLFNRLTISFCFLSTTQFFT